MAIDGKFFEDIRGMSIEHLAESLRNIPREMIQAVGYKAIDICNSQSKCLWLGINYRNPNSIDTARASVAAYLIITEPPVHSTREVPCSVPIHEYAPA